MNPGSSSNRTSKSGSIMMETVIAIPIFMIMLGGIIWLGDLMVARQSLMIADRYTVWSYGSRHAPGHYDTDTIHDRFFDGSDFRIPTAVETAQKVTDWSLEASGMVTLQMQMPDWTRFMFNAGNVMYESGVPESNMKLIGRSQTGGHVVLMRTKDEAAPAYLRNQYGIPESGQVYVKWRDIAAEKWPYE
jgi:hypothetical protein